MGRIGFGRVSLIHEAEIDANLAPSKGLVPFYCASD
jgi:hypothetical protein